MKHKNIKVMTFVLFVIATLFVQLVPVEAAVGKNIGVEIISIEINDVDNVDDGETVLTRFKRGDTLDIDVKILATEDAENLRVKVRIDGYDHGTLEAESSQFDVLLEEDDVTGVYAYESVELELPEDMVQDRYRLEVVVSNRDGLVSNNYYLKIDTEQRDLEIRDVDFYPGLIAKPGGFTGVVRLKNTGEKDEHNAKVTMSIPALHLSAFDYIDDFEAEDIKSTEPLYMRIPECTAPGIYTVSVDVSYYDGTKHEYEEYELQIIEGDLCEALQNDGIYPEVTVLLDKGIQELTVGGDQVVYPLSIFNPGSTIKSYTVSVSGAEVFGNVQIKPSNVIVLEPQKQAVISVYVEPKEDVSEGQYAFSIDLMSGDEVVSQTPLMVNVAEEDSSFWDNFKTAIIVIALFGALVFIGFVVILAFTKAKEAKEVQEPVPMESDFGVESDYSNDLEAPMPVGNDSGMDDYY